MPSAVAIRRFDCPLCNYCVYASRPVGCPECGNVEPDAMTDAGKVGVVGTDNHD